MSLDHQVGGLAFQYLARTSYHSLQEGARTPRSTGAQALRGLLGVQPGQVTALLFRQVATPNYEMRHFLNICHRNRWRPVALTFHADKMSCHNIAKRALVQLKAIRGLNKKSEPIWSRYPLASYEEVENRPLGDIDIDGRSLVGLHETALRIALENGPKTIDGSNWCNTYTNGARDYYLDLMESLGDGLVLVEDFLTEDRAESKFFSFIAQPAFARAAEKAKRPPPIAALTFGRRIDSPFWYAYPANYLAHFRAAGAKV